MPPYAAALGDRDVLASLSSTPSEYAAIVAALAPGDLDRRAAPGKWSIAEQLTHLAQTEMAFGVRVRMALTTPRYVVQPFDQDAWMAREPIVGGREAFEIYAAMRRLNLPLFKSLSAEERAREFAHPEQGPITVWWVVQMLAGHELHHLSQIRALVGAQT